MLSQLLSRYATREGRFDELLAAPQVPRPHWARFVDNLARREGPEVSDTLALMEREIRENGITYNVYADPQGADRPWEVDPLPLLLDAAEWAQIEAGVAQRAELLNRVLGDVYGAQTLLRSGRLPPAVVFGHSGFLHQAQGIAPPGGVHLFQYAADLARAPNGQWWVVGDRTQAPSGMGYALENRLVISRVFPALFGELRVQSLTPFFTARRDALLSLAPKSAEPPLIGLLTPGPYNETYFEHALLARYLGLALVEGHDLTVRDGCVWLKTVEGLKRVHALLRRQDDDYCDPLELRSNSALGVAGLTDCARRGTVLIANALGSGVLESSALLAYLPMLSEHLLGEPLKMPSVATWWLGEPQARADAWRRLDQILIKPLVPDRREPAVFGADLSAAQCAELQDRVARNPQRYVAQEWVRLSQAPVLERGGPRDLLAARSVGLRVFAVATPDGYKVMPGGLTRVAAEAHSRVIAMQRGGRSKDTWVLSEAPVNASFSLLASTVTPSDLSHKGTNLPSRVAENLFWLGRYGERCDASARLLRVAISGLLGDAGSAATAPELVFARRLGLIDEDAPLPAGLIRAATHPDEGLGDQVRQLSRVAFNLRDRMSPDNWRTLHQLISDTVFRRGASTQWPVQLPFTLGWLDRAITGLMTFSGFVMDGMPRDLGWQFTSLGRRIERLSNLCAAMEVASQEGRAQGLEWLLEWTDTAVVYRSRYLVAPEWLPVLDLLLRDETHPRSVAFQAQGLGRGLERLQRAGAPRNGHAIELFAAAHAGLRHLPAVDLDPESPALARVLSGLRQAAHAVSDELTWRYFTHAASRSVLSLVA
jgi:uncharacterized circularly permuted ATP-grasp superfamily protein/uncharacterized alpha-E superfamily protein